MSRKSRVKSSVNIARFSFLKRKFIDQDVYTASIERMRHLFRAFDHVALSFSGGKDSTIALNLALQVAREFGRLPFDVYFCDEEVVAPEVVEYCERLRDNKDIRFHWICVPLAYANMSDQEDKWFCWDESIPQEKWVRQKPDFAITEVDGYDHTKSVLGASHVVSLLLRKERGKVAIILGIRAQESPIRRRMVSAREHENFIMPATTGDQLGRSASRSGNLWKAMPIYDWSDNDVWLALSRFKWDYCKAYDKMMMAGIHRHDQRVAPPFGVGAAGLWMWHECWPEMWDAVAERVAGVHTAARYAHTSVYGKGDINTLRKPKGKTWETYLKDCYENIKDVPMRSAVAKRVNEYIHFHNRVTQFSPIAGYAIHPGSGVSWAYLVRTVLRKDKDGRDAPTSRIVRKGTKEYKKKFDLYLKEIQDAEETASFDEKKERKNRSPKKNRT